MAAAAAILSALPAQHRFNAAQSDLRSQFLQNGSLNARHQESQKRKEYLERTDDVDSDSDSDTSTSISGSGDEEESEPSEAGGDAGPDIGWIPDRDNFNARVARLAKDAHLRAVDLPAGFPSVVESQRAWTGAAFEDEDTFIVHLSETDVQEIESALLQFLGSLTPLDRLAELAGIRRRRRRGRTRRTTEQLTVSKRSAWAQVSQPRFPRVVPTPHACSEARRSKSDPPQRAWLRCHPWVGPEKV